MPYETDRLTAPRPHLRRLPNRHRAPAKVERDRVPLSWLRRDHTPLPYESDRPTAPHDAARARPPVNWVLVGVWATVVAVSLATWFGLVWAVVALV
jgi:hypothetical protein